MFSRKLVLAAGLCVALLSLNSPLLAQAVNGTLLGTVQDSTGASIANAKVTATQAETGAARDTVTNATGNYTMPDLPPGTYSVSIVATGFKKETRQNITLLNNTSTRIDVDLQTGSITETVLVTTAPPLLQTDRADISTKIEARQVADLPLGTNRNFQSLLNLVPGTSPATFQHSSSSTHKAPSRLRSTASPAKAISTRSKASTTTSAPVSFRSSFRPPKPSRPSTSPPTTSRPSSAAPPAPSPTSPSSPDPTPFTAPRSSSSRTAPSTRAPTSAARSDTSLITTSAAASVAPSSRTNSSSSATISVPPITKTSATPLPSRLPPSTP